MDIFAHLTAEITPPPLGVESCAFDCGAGRVLAEAVYANRSVPAYPESTRDGFALAQSSTAQPECYHLIDKESAAGNTEEIILQRGEACPVMTGGLIPLNTQRVMPQEYCQIDGSDLRVSGLSISSPFIKSIGDEIAEKDVIAGQGTILRAAHLALFATTGNYDLCVFKKPRVGYFATGSELVSPQTPLVPGMKVASNRYILSELCTTFGGDGSHLGILPDTMDALSSFFAQLQEPTENEMDVLISTGGMGPGRYDLVEECFKGAGGRVVVNSLPLIPGKSILIGWLQNTLFFALPGNPNALLPLFTEIIGRALLSLQGVVGQYPIERQAILQSNIKENRSDSFRLHPGNLGVQGTTGVVSSAGRGELPNCYIIISPRSLMQMAGSEVTVHMIRSPFSL